jgi:hypothetical protein
MNNIYICVLFPSEEWEKIKYENITGIYYKKDKLYTLGKIINIQKHSSDIIISTEIRKDETPFWYAFNILEEATKYEILVSQNEINVEKGVINNIEYPNDKSDTTIIDNLIFTCSTA